MKHLKILHVISGDLWAGAEVQAYTLLKHLNTNTELLVVLMNQGELSLRLQELGIATKILNERKLSSLTIFFSLCKIIREFSPDVIHTHRQKENILTSAANLLTAICQLQLIPSVRTIHGAPEFSPKGKQKLQAWLDQWVGRHLQNRVIAVSQDLAHKLSAIYPKSHIAIIPNGVDKENLKLQARIAEFRLSAPSKSHVGIIGRLEPVKRIDIFLNMAALLVKEDFNRNWLFHIIGDGKLREKMELLAQELNIQNYVIFHGHRNDVPSCIASLDAIVMCSDHEGMPMTALEALALETPLIAHDVGGLSEALQAYPEQLVTQHDARGYADTLSKCLSNLSKINQLPNAYTSTENALRTLNTYQDVI